VVLCNTTPLNWNGRWKPYCCPRPNAEPSQTRLYLFFLLPSRFIVCGTWQLLCGGTTSSFTASEGTPYAHIHVLIPPYQFHLLTLLSFLAGPPRFTPALNSAHSYQHASSHLSPGHSFSPPSLLHSTLQRTFPYPIPTLFRSPRHRFLMLPAPQPPQEGSPTPGNRSRTHCKPSRRIRDRGHVLYPRCLCIEREAAFRPGAAFGFWSRVCRVIFNPVAVVQH